MNNPKKILLIESDAELSKKIADMLNSLEDRKLEVARVSELSQALGLLAEEPVDIALLNLMLSDAGGIHSLKRFFKQIPELPVVVINGPEDRSLALSCIEEGAQDYIGLKEMGTRTLSRAIDFAFIRKTTSASHFQEEIEREEELKSKAIQSIGRSLEKQFAPKAENVSSNLEEIRDQLQEDFPLAEKLVERLEKTGMAAKDLATLANELKDLGIELTRTSKDHKEPRILVVEDEPGVMEVIVGRLERLGFRKITTAKNGREAYNLCAKSITNGERFDLIISDWKMPEWSGLYLLERLRENFVYKGVRFMMVTAVDEKKDILSAVELKVDEYLLKPFTSTQFDSALNRLIFSRASEG